MKPSSMMIRFFASACLLAAQPGQAQQERIEDFPSRPMRLIVPFGAGGGPDVIGRRLAQGLAEKTGRNVVVDNRVGATGVIGMAELARATANGYSIGLLNAATPVAQVMMTKPGVQIERDVEPVVQLLRYYTILVVRPEVQARNAKDLVAMVRDKPGAYSFGSGGNGTPAHLAGELFMRAVGAKASHVPYKQVSVAVGDLIRGDLLFICSAVSNVAPMLHAGRLKALGVVGPSRIKMFPDVPSFVELGLPDPNVLSWTGIVAPTGTPLSIRRKLNALLGEVANEPANARFFETLGLELVSVSLEQFGAVLRAELMRWRQFVQEAGIRID